MITVGERVAHARKVAGLTQDQLAARVDRTREWVSLIERGVVPLDSMSMINTLAGVLGVGVSYLLGLDDPTNDDPVMPHVKALRHALQRSAFGLGTPHATVPKTLDELRAEVDTANRLRLDAAFMKLGESLPGLLDDLRQAVTYFDGLDREVAQIMLVEALHDARAMAKKVGALDLAWIAAEQARSITERLGDPLLIAANRWNLAEVASSDGDPRAAANLCAATLDDLEPELAHGGPGAWALWGQMHLKAAMMAAYWSRRQDAMAHLRAADDAARRLGGDRNDYGTAFGPSNVRIHRVGVAVELGDDALEVAKGFNPKRVRERERQARYWLDIARAYSRRQRYNKAASSLLRAEKIGGAYIRRHPLAREITAALVRRERAHMREPVARLARAIPVE
ncbi:hypothetical protein TH66_21020 [Carbonactinospora thermoautotrophica]|uniref:HTH cro/C1-type domain-containing protein n=1 Tax=Carbonactinospora thermoautotrophica TaxID=1469144 RepID=A0A132NB63_9ACTN|nr:helix-turn-helix domain-containing protein [Carbonactinospora thermoautotrophica]KWW97889.1 hypothetical protein TH66_21020 [Carbonactinospora thermoautotrophica]KWX07348.1 hypothetical protein TR74_19075 [Carbonactinospora thermoautotrophica]